MPEESRPAPPPGGTSPGRQTPPDTTDPVDQAPTLAPEAAAAAADRPSLPRVPGYEVLREIDRGGMGVVFLARQDSLGRTVALKMMRAAALAGPEDVARFRKEAEAVARLEHPHIVRVYDFGTHEGLPFFTMEFVDGGSLKDLLARGTPDPRGAAALVAALARAVQHAHDRGVVHRDLKPANVLLQMGSGEWGLGSEREPPGASSFPTPHSHLPIPKIADFGLAKRLDAGAPSTATGAVMGTAPYMAPEQAGGRSREVGPHTDVWALGAVLYELLTGHPPFEGVGTLETLLQVVSQDPIPPSQRRPGVPQALEAVCLHCLEKDPARRYASARALAEDLERFLAGEAPAAGPAPEWERHTAWARKAGYEIVELLNCGFAGWVYRARQVALDRVVALKVMTAAGAGDEELARFRREARAVATLHHPHVVQVHDGGQLAGLPFFSMEYLEGGNLASRHADGPPPPREAAALARALARALHHVHGRGLLHLNLKPGNVLLGADGQPRLAGFGLACLRGQTGPHAVRGRFGRLASFLAPEQAGGAGPLDPATDVYRLGAVLYYLLTGEPPFLAETLEETRALVRDRPPRPPRQVRPGVPAELEAICLRCLEKDPVRRYGSAESLAEALDHFLRTAPEMSLPFAASYEVLAEVSRSGPATLYRARERETGRVVALRVIDLDACGGPQARVDALRAAMLVAQLRHPHVAAVESVSERQGHLLLQREWAEAGTLANRPLGRSVPETARLGEALARALDHAHRAGVLHLAVRPANVLLTADGSPRLADFHPPGFPTGTPREQGAGLSPYLAPEQLGGRACGPATDVFALGVLLYERLTGRVPFQGSRPTLVLYQMNASRPAPPSQVRPGLGSGLDEICLRCLRPEPADRFRTAGDLADALSLVTGGSGFPPPRASGPRPLWDRLFGWTRRGRRGGRD
jgi:serine/threonine protein kinase